MAKQFTVESSKSYATAENAAAAFQKRYGNVDNLRFFVMQVPGSGRFIPVALLNAGPTESALHHGVHFHFNVVG